MMGKENFARGFNGVTDEEEMAAGAAGDGLTAQEMPEGGTEQAATLPAEGGGDLMAGDPAAEVGAGDPMAGAEAGAEAAGAMGDSDAGLHGEQPIGGEPEMNQSERSWNGRLTAREAELKARAEELEKREAMLPMEYKEAVAFLTDHFGEEFVSAVAAVAMGAGKGAVESSTAELMTKIDDVTNSMRDGFGMVHGEMISSVHEDYMDIAESDQFKDYIDGLPDEEKAAAMEVIEGGTPRQVVRLLTSFKDSLKTEQPQENQQDDKYDTAALDAAAGVRSAGGRAPSFGGDAVAAGGEVDRFRAGFNAR